MLLAPQQAMDRLAEVLAFDIPQGQIDGGHGRDGDRAAAAIHGAAIHLLPQPLGLQRVLADQQRSQPGGHVVAERSVDHRLDHFGRGIGLADPLQAGVGLDANEHRVLAAGRFGFDVLDPQNLTFDFGDFHASSVSIMPGVWRGMRLVAGGWPSCFDWAVPFCFSDCTTLGSSILGPPDFHGNTADAARVLWANGPTGTSRGHRPWGGGPRTPHFVFGPSAQDKLQPAYRDGPAFEPASPDRTGHWPATAGPMSPLRGSGGMPRWPLLQGRCPWLLHVGPSALAERRWQIGMIAVKPLHRIRTVPVGFRKASQSISRPTTTMCCPRGMGATQA